MQKVGSERGEKKGKVKVNRMDWRVKKRWKHDNERDKKEKTVNINKHTGMERRKRK